MRYREKGNMMQRPHIIKQDILKILTAYELAAGEMELAMADAKMQVDHIDLLATKAIVADAQVILFSAEQALALRPALQRFAEALEYRLPFPSILIQFSQPIPETAFFEPEISDAPESEAYLENLGLAEGDKICAIALDQQEDSRGKLLNNAVAWFASTAVNRAAWENRPDAHLRINRLVTQDPQGDIRTRNKRALQLWAIALVAYLNCENITLVRQVVDDKVNRKRARTGKQLLEPYYFCQIRDDRPATGVKLRESDISHSFRYDVRGHFRRLPDGRLTWVRPHQRGLEHAFYRPKAYQVE